MIDDSQSFDTGVIFTARNVNTTTTYLILAEMLRCQVSQWFVGN